ncbi:MAG: transketolase C-terminal domain-containing protein [Paracoccus sp. (in: a-proteobacteria)]
MHPSVQVAKKLAAEGRSVGVIDMATVKPIDRDAILEAAARSKSS